MKYIDADKLIAEIERMREINRKAFEAEHIESGVFHGRAQAINHLFEFIDSLRQEQPERICSRCRHFDKKEDCCNCPYGGMRYSINENGVYKCNSFDEVEQEQPEIDLEKEIDDYYRENLGLILSQVDTKVIVSEIARHFYALGLNARKED